MSCAITYARIGRTKEIAPGCSLLAAFKLHNVPIAYSCEMADCGTCVVRIETGQECLTPMDEIEDATLRRYGYAGASDPQHRLACQAMIRRDGALTVRNKV